MFVVGTAGHIDHGKSALVRKITGIDPDRLPEEKARGLTIDLGFAWTDLPSGRSIGIVDVPGHERFVKNMVAGVGGIDAVVLVIAADDGWMPQTEEHFSILKLLEVKTGIVALGSSQGRFSRKQPDRAGFEPNRRRHRRSNKCSRFGVDRECDEVGYRRRPAIYRSQVYHSGNGDSCDRYITGRPSCVGSKYRGSADWS